MNKKRAKVSTKCLTVSASPQHRAKFSQEMHENAANDRLSWVENGRILLHSESQDAFDHDRGEKFAISGTVSTGPFEFSTVGFYLFVLGLASCVVYSGNRPEVWRKSPGRTNNHMKAAEFSQTGISVAHIHGCLLM